MKEYQIRKTVRAKSLRDALRLEKKTEVEYIVMTDDDDEDEEEDDKLENGKIYGFRNKHR